MRTLEKGQDKIKKICDALRQETLEPAKEEAHAIVKESKKKAEEIIAEAQNEAQQIIKKAKSQLDQERKIFESSLQRAAKQAVEELRQEIENKFFNEELSSLLDRQMTNPKLVAELINGIVRAIEKEGISQDLSVVIPRLVSTEEVANALLGEIKAKLKERPIEVGNFAGGARVKLEGKNITLDLTEQSLKELLAKYVRKDFRELIFD